MSSTSISRPIVTLEAIAPNEVTLSWFAVVGASSYVVTYALAITPTVVAGGYVVAGGDTTTTTVTGLAPNTAYYITLRAKHRTSISAPYIVSATTTSLLILSTLPSNTSNITDPLFDTPPNVTHNLAHSMVLTANGYTHSGDANEYNHVTWLVGKVPTDAVSARNGPRITIELVGATGDAWSMRDDKTISNFELFVGCTTRLVDNTERTLWFNANRQHVPTLDTSPGAHCLSPLTQTLRTRVLSFGPAWPVADTDFYVRVGLTHDDRVISAVTFVLVS